MKSTRDELDREIAAMRDALGVTSDAQLADILGLTRGAVSQWRNRGSIPDKARTRVRSFQKGGARFAEMDARRQELGGQRLYEGRCLALYLAPACDAVISRRFTLANYMGSLRNYASLMDEICLACAEQIAERQAQIGGNATDAFDSLCADDPRQIYERIIDRALEWRNGSEDAAIK